MNSSLDRARTATSNAWNGAVDLAASAIPRLPPVGLSLAATLAGLYEARRLLAGLRAGLAQVTCPSCSIQFRHYQEDCPACLRREQLRDLEQRGLEEVLVQNNLLDEEALAEAVLHSRNEGKALEEVLLERGLVSPASLNQARYYLARAPGMGVRAKDLLGERAAKRRWPVAPQALMVRGGALLLMGTTLALTLPRLLS